MNNRDEKKVDKWIVDIVENLDRSWWQIWKPEYIILYNDGSAKYLFKRWI